jgi:hypothetical protein
VGKKFEKADTGKRKDIISCLEGQWVVYPKMAAMF